LEALIAKWRREAAKQPRISSNDVDIRLTLKRCADELERAWHDEDHSAVFVMGCRPCDLERQES
jgi:hypothetical protein